VVPFWILYNNLSFLLVLLSSNLSQPVSLYRYLIYIRPIFEYACEVWDNCGVSNSCKLERLQLEEARIITGLPIFANTEYLYRETGWERLEERRTRRKLKLLYNIQNGTSVLELYLVF
jgi:hypothetical protein